MLGAGVVSTAIAMLPMVALVKQVGAANTALPAFIVPLFAVAWRRLRRRMGGLGGLAGLVAILAGAALSGRRPVPAPEPATAAT